VVQRSAGSRGEGSAAETVRRETTPACFDSRPRQSVRRIVTRAAWQELWRGKKEETSSSPSGQHFGHHVSGGKLDIGYVGLIS
jgi:hypothetical protein